MSSAGAQEHRESNKGNKQKQKGPIFHLLAANLTVGIAQKDTAGSGDTPPD